MPTEDAASPAPSRDDWRSSTAERPRVVLDDRTRSIPPVRLPVVPDGSVAGHDVPADLPRAARWPLWADGSDEPAIVLPPAPVPPQVAPASAAPSADAARARRVLPWIAVAAAVTLLAAGTTYAATGEDRVLVSSVEGDPGAQARGDAPTDDAEAAAAPGAEASTGTRPEGTSRDAVRERGADDEDLRGRAEPLTGDARVTAPVTASANEDLGGERVTFDAANLVDGEPTTAWRMPGNGRDTVLTLRLPRPAEITSVGAINGYAKTGSDGDREVDWYDANRRVRTLEWFFDDGTRVVQRMDRTLDLQRTSVDPTLTRTIRVKIAGVSAPGDGPDGRDFTALSELAVDGVPVDGARD